MIEAQENPLDFMMTNSFYEVQKYVARTDHSITLPFLFISEASWQKLNADQQALLTTCADEARLYEKQLRADIVKETESFLAEKGTVIHDVDRAEFSEAVAKVYPTYSENTQMWIEKIQALPR